jgi:hypothetical protein
MKRATILTIMTILPVCLVWGQSERHLKQYFEGRKVQVELDMPATSDGIDMDVFPNGQSQLNFGDYSKRLKKYGISLHDGDITMVTKIKVKKKMIEFQLGGGGYGTFGDPTDTSVHFIPAPKSQREKDLEYQVDHEKDRRKRDKLRSELNDLRWRREREDNRLRRQAEADADRRAADIAQRREQGGSRFNLHYGDKVTPQDLTTEKIMNALGRYVKFSNFDGQQVATPEGTPAPAPAGGVASLKKGMTRAAVEKLLGGPVSMKETTEGSMNLLTCVYEQGGASVTAVFYDTILIRYTISSE